MEEYHMDIICPKDALCYKGKQKHNYVKMWKIKEDYVVVSLVFKSWIIYVYILGIDIIDLHNIIEDIIIDDEWFICFMRKNRKISCDIDKFLRIFM